jgi:hypothetical protein
MTDLQQIARLDRIEKVIEFAFGFFVVAVFFGLGFLAGYGVGYSI